MGAAGRSINVGVSCWWKEEQGLGMMTTSKCHTSD